MVRSLTDARSMTAPWSTVGVTHPQLGTATLATVGGSSVALPTVPLVSCVLCIMAWEKADGSLLNRLLRTSSVPPPSPFRGQRGQTLNIHFSFLSTRHPGNASPSGAFTLLVRRRRYSARAFTPGESGQHTATAVAPRIRDARLRAFSPWGFRPCSFFLCVFAALREALS